jgi:hypothetical protein
VVHRLGPDLLGGHVADGAEHGSRARPRIAVLADGPRLLVREGFDALELGQAEVEDLDAAVASQEEVLGFEVSVDDAAVVGGGEAARHLASVVDGLARGQRRAVDPVAQCLPVEQLRDHVGRALVRPYVVDGDDVGMVERAGGAGLLLEAAQPLGVRGQRCGQDLDRDVARQPRVPRAVDLAHPARAQRGRDLVGPELGSSGEGHGLVSEEGRDAITAPAGRP